MSLVIGTEVVAEVLTYLIFAGELESTDMLVEQLELLAAKKMCFLRQLRLA